MDDWWIDDGQENNTEFGCVDDVGSRRLDFLHRRHYKRCPTQNRFSGLRLGRWSSCGHYLVPTDGNPSGFSMLPVVMVSNHSTTSLSGLNLVHGIYVLCTQRALIAVGFQIPEVLPCRAGHSRLNWSLFIITTPVIVSWWEQTPEITHCTRTIDFPSRETTTHNAINRYGTQPIGDNRRNGKP